MFWKKFWEKRKIKEKEPHYDVDSEKLAIPEVHLHGQHGHKEEGDVHHHGEDVYKREGKDRDGRIVIYLWRK